MAETPSNLQSYNAMYSAMIKARVVGYRLGLRQSDWLNRQPPAVLQFVEWLGDQPDEQLGDLARTHTWAEFQDSMYRYTSTSTVNHIVCDWLSLRDQLRFWNDREMC